MELNEDNFSEQIESGKLVMVDFWAEWCGPCRMLGPIVESLAEEYQNDDRIVVSKINVDSSTELAQKFGIRNISTVVFFKDGEVVDKQVGVSSKETYSQMIEKHI